MIPLLGDVGVWSSPGDVIMLVIHLLVAVFALGAVTHYWWAMLGRPVKLDRLTRYAKWMAVSYPLAWLTGVVIYPTYNVLVRKPPRGLLEATARWAVGLFEIKEHVGTIALVMLPLLVLCARRYERLSRAERITHVLATWVFTLFVYYSFIAGAIVTNTKGMP
jgi:branched-subunit amino acid transport protein AzlD